MHADADSVSYLSSDTYGASRFGEFGEYMTRKRAKLQIQNTEMDMEGNKQDATTRLFHGLQIYINGWTEPSVQDLRQLIVRYGGIYHPYLDKKGLVTHIVTCILTPAKIREFKHMKVVRPEWLVESARAGVLLPWHNFAFRPGERVEQTQGRRSARMSLFEGLASQNSNKVATSAPCSPPQTPTKERGTEQSSIQPLYTTDPATPEQAARVSGYAAHKSNLHAERAMADPSWRAAHTSVAPDFIEGYYRNSRLHHLSTWKAELRTLIIEAQEHVESGQAAVWGHSGDGAKGEDGVSMRGAQFVMRSAGKGKGKAREQPADAEERVIMHCDFDSFFVSAGLIDRPHLRGKPVVVCHSQGNQGGASSTSEIASASYEARKFGIRSGMSLQQARKLCPTLLTMPYEFQRYKQLSLQFYTILMAHADDLQAVSVDEALIDVTGSVKRICAEMARSQDLSTSPADHAKGFAEAIRAQVRKVTGCEVSIGIAHNIMLARVASRKAKPAGSFRILPQDAQALLAPLDIDDLHGFGYSARQKALERLGTTTLGELADRSKAMLCDALGKGMGEILYKAIRGIDDCKLESDKPRKSVSCDINYGIRFENNAQAATFVSQMAEEVARRLDSIDMRGRSLTLKIMKRDPKAPVEAPKFMGHGLCETFSKQAPLIAPGGHATSDPQLIGELAWRLLKSFNFDHKELRGISIQIQKLEKSAAASTIETGQAVLPFKSKAATELTPMPHAQSANVDTKGDKAPAIVVQPPSQDDDIQIIEPPPAAQAKPVMKPEVFDLPSFSQVDLSIFQALPDDVRQELEGEYKRRSVTPDLRTEAASRSRSPSIPIMRKTKITVKGTNVRRITQQLAPRSRSAISPQKSSLFLRRAGPSVVNVSEKELRKLNIDPEVFAVLPVDLQREQLSAARQLKRPGATVYLSQRRPLKPRKLKPPLVPYYRAPPPRAKYIDPPTLKQQGKTKGEKLHFTETDDVQRVIEAWVNGFKEHPPNQRDVDYFAKFLTQCVDSSRSTDTGVEKAVAVAKWWLVLLRRHFGVWEHASCEISVTEGQVTSESVGRAWWAAFREVKQKMDVVARKKFGGCLSLR
ncbi:hypothetical protein POSPLADRAFT_1186762 [Postia placenta MAD-698-R-SB12]|uniref:DNA repair protein REV1 n=1 Tax=Postia placenta MAD-698-R-SB12 TaxID=670580 RepID=A0A1X6MIV0_9APHY|nr:hypothetical protein POSPLADRAFT_1186762 [Postia placenta MAD-698-R-SB12]OSX56265.1 hypothetical protein POSPLADRAFT_1186762 [Postia placenta MAD-698-R-SB12]